MPLSAHVNGYLWAISAEGAVFFTPSISPAWQCLSLPTTTTTLAASEALDLLFIACDDGSLHAIQASSGNVVRSSATPLHSRPLCLVVVASEQALFAGLSDGAVVRIHLPSLAFDCMLGCGVEHSSAVHALAVDNHYLYSAGDDTVVLVWDLKDLTTVRDFSVSSVAIRSLLRIGFVLWLGLHNGTVQVIEIFGDDLNGVTNVSAKRPHNSPVVDLVQVGQTQVWSLEQAVVGMPSSSSPLSHPSDNLIDTDTILNNNNNNTVSTRSNVAVWDIHDFTYRLSDEVDNVFVRSLAIVRSEPFHRVTVAALSPDLSAQLVVSNVLANGQSLTSPVNEATNNSFPDAQMYEQQQVYVKDLERQLAAATEKLRLTDIDDTALNTTDDANAQLSSRGVQQQHPQHNPSDDVVVNSSSIGEDAQLLVSTALPTLTVPVTADPFVMPASVTDAIQTSLNKLADVLASLLTEDVLSCDTGLPRKQQSASTAAAIGTPVRRRKPSKYGTSSAMSGTGSVSSAMNLPQLQHQKEHVRNTIAALTKELNMARQLVACCVSGDDVNSRTTQLLKNMREIPPTSPNPIISITSSASLNDIKSSIDMENSKAGLIRDLKRRVDELIGRAERAESDARTVRNERDLLKDEVSHEREQAERTLCSLEGLLRERTNTIEARDSEIEELRLACDDAEAKLRDERSLRKSTEEKRDELKRINRKLADRCKSVEAELNDATAAVELARKDLAQKEESLRKHIAKRECELDHLNLSLKATQRDYDALRQQRPNLSHNNNDNNDHIVENDNADIDNVCVLSSSQNQQLQEQAVAMGPEANSKARSDYQLAAQHQRIPPPPSIQEAQTQHPGPEMPHTLGRPTPPASEERDTIPVKEVKTSCPSSEHGQNENDENVNAANEISTLKKELDQAHARIAQLELEKMHSMTNIIQASCSDHSKATLELANEHDPKPLEGGVQTTPTRPRQGSNIAGSPQRSTTSRSGVSAKKTTFAVGHPSPAMVGSKNGDSPVKSRQGRSKGREDDDGDAAKNASDLNRLQRECDELKRQLVEEASVIEELKQTVRRYVNGDSNGVSTTAGQQEQQEPGKQNQNYTGERKNANVTSADKADAKPGLVENSINLNMVNLELSRLHDEVDLLQSEVEHRQAAASLYEEEAENMKCVISDLRLATNELQASLERSDEETRQLYTTLEEMRATLRMRDMRIAALEGRVAALSCARDDVTLTGNENNDSHSRSIENVEKNCDTNSGAQEEHQQQDGKDVSSKQRTTEEEDDNMRARALEALLASANGEIEHMAREMEALYRAQVARDKELHSVYDGLQLRDERIRKRDSVIENLRTKLGDAQRRLQQQQQRQESHKYDTAASTAVVGGMPNGKGHSTGGAGRDGGDDNKQDTTSPGPKGVAIVGATDSNTTGIQYGTSTPPTERQQAGHTNNNSLLLDISSPSPPESPASPTSTSASSLSGAPPDDMVKGMLKELSEGVVVTKQRMRDVLRLAREYKQLAQAHISMLPMLHEVECNLARITSSMPHRRGTSSGADVSSSFALANEDGRMAAATSALVQMDGRSSSTASTGNNVQEEQRKAVSVLATTRGIMQCIIAHFYSTQQKKSCLGASAAAHAVYQPCDHRLSTLLHSLRQAAH